MDVDNGCHSNKATGRATGPLIGRHSCNLPPAWLIRGAGGQDSVARFMLLTLTFLSRFTQCCSDCAKTLFWNKDALKYQLLLLHRLAVLKSALKVLQSVRNRGVLYAAKSVAARLLTRPVGSAARYAQEISGRMGLEIGGPSFPFKDHGIVPLYRYAARIDNCIFAAKNVWAEQRDGQAYTFHELKQPGLTFVREAYYLRDIPDRAYDFILSSHMLEHSANPIRALKEWQRVTKPASPFIIVLPHHCCTFDHRRKTTDVAHILEDYYRGAGEDDMTHLEEILSLHDLSMDPEAGTRQEFVSRSLKNLEFRCLHHHVFDQQNATGLLEASGLKVESVEFANPYHIVMLAHSGSV